MPFFQFVSPVFHALVPACPYHVNDAFNVKISEFPLVDSIRRARPGNVPAIFQYGRHESVRAAAGRYQRVGVARAVRAPGDLSGTSPCPGRNRSER